MCVHVVLTSLPLSHPQLDVIHEHEGTGDEEEEEEEEEGQEEAGAERGEEDEEGRIGDEAPSLQLPTLHTSV